MLTPREVFTGVKVTPAPSFDDLKVGQCFKWVTPRGGGDVICLKIALSSASVGGDQFMIYGRKVTAAWVALEGEQIGMIFGSVGVATGGLTVIPL